jgi:hypothetical protein
MKRKMYLVMDVEGTNGTDCPIVYDVGGAVCDKKGKIYDDFSFVVSDIFDNERDLMDTAYYANKLPLYHLGLEVGMFKRRSFFQVKQYVKELIEKYQIGEVFAYNAHYDITALNTTQRWLTKSKYRWFLPYGVKVSCIMHMACQVLCTQKSYAKFVDDNCLRKNSGNLPTSAEIVYSYIDEMFHEVHVGCEDVKIEVEIMARCFRQKKKMDRSINRLAWKIPQRSG